MEHVSKQQRTTVQKTSTDVQRTARHGGLSNTAVDVIQRMKVPGQGLRPADIMALQATVGNQVVQRLLNRQRRTEVGHGGASAPIIQPKLTVGPAHDHYEEEADKVSSQIMRTSSIQRSPAISKIQRKASSKDGFETDSNFESELKRTKGQGQPLPDSTRSEFESKFGSSFKNVRIHTNTQSNQLNRAIQAKAFTHGNDIHFASGQYNPNSSDGKRLLAHELTHTIQQTGGQTLQRHGEDSLAHNKFSPAQNLTIQRKLNFAQTDLQGRLSKTTKLMGFLGRKSTFAKIQIELANYFKADGPAEELASLMTLKQLAGHWLARHLSDKNNSVKERSVTRLLLEVDAEIPKVQQRIKDDQEEQEEYVRQLEKASQRQDASLEFLSSSGINSYKNMKGWHSGTDPMGGNQAAIVNQLCQQHGLTLAEASAIGIYTADDYKYMNPAMAGNRGWMRAMLPQLGIANRTMLRQVRSGVTDAHIDQAMTEGKLHGKIALSGMKKLPNWVGSAFRGLALTEEDFAAQYPLNSVTVFPAFSSTSTNENVSRSFARRYATDGKVAILLRLQVTKGKNIKWFSDSPQEDEVLLMPGATFKVVKIKETQYRNDKMYEVTLRQVH